MPHLVMQTMHLQEHQLHPEVSLDIKPHLVVSLVPMELLVDTMLLQVELLLLHLEHRRHRLTEHQLPILMLHKVHLLPVSQLIGLLEQGLQPVVLDHLEGLLLVLVQHQLLLRPLQDDLPGSPSFSLTLASPCLSQLPPAR